MQASDIFDKLKNWLEKLQVAAPLLRNRYVATTLAFIVWVGFFDQNNFIDRISLANHNRELKRQKELYNAEIIKNRENLEELRSNSDKLEKFAREEYMMKRADEDLFIILED
jgi:cell division protein FtsB